MKAVIMAGGEGTRLRPLTSNAPKPMMPIANTPMMEHIVALLRERVVLPRFEGRRVVEDPIVRLVREEHAGEAYRVALPGGVPMVVDGLVIGSMEEGVDGGG